VRTSDSEDQLGPVMLGGCIRGRGYGHGHGARPGGGMAKGIEDGRIRLEGVGG
jgi:hypothetical protein